MYQTVVEEDGLSCQRFGKITAIDCSCLRDVDCGDCFIFKSLLESDLDIQKYYFEDILLNQAISLEVN
jgi:hypothetical protein